MIYPRMLAGARDLDRQGCDQERRRDGAAPKKRSIIKNAELVRRLK